MKYRYIFGPVPSRRLGVSLGIDLVPYKICSLNCLYCECGITTNLTLVRKEYVPQNEVIKELDHFLSNNPAPEYITFSGSGEPTLHSGIAGILSRIKTIWPDIPVALLTNGTLFTIPGVRKEVLSADLIVPSLDAASQSTFLEIDRPVPGLDADSHIQGLVDLRKEFAGKIWLEVFILPGVNDDESELELLKEAILKIHPDKVQLNSLDRPGAVPGLCHASAHQLYAIKEGWRLSNVEITVSAAQRKTLASYTEDVSSHIFETIYRRPSTADELAQMLGTHVNEVNKYLGVLEEDGKIKPVLQEGKQFYKKT
ncbi:MAG: radical SAM protein [Spirochaetia bacterium]